MEAGDEAGNVALGDEAGVAAALGDEAGGADLGEATSEWLNERRERERVVRQNERGSGGVAIRKGCQIGGGMTAGNIVLETDSLEAIRLIERNNISCHAYSAIIEDIQLMLRANPRWKITHIFREGNQCADFMAKLGSASDDDYVIWDSPPDGIGHLLLADRMSTLFLRE
ncbi:ribonuclease H [Senna tora]|uniref:Ribonuclease H n=1 Tax=Senna tora TaxID=362788 RepID=A0A834WT18_9FABA|nr:ribonuclease H [Senna tora]